MKTSIFALSALLASIATAQYQGVPDCAKDCVNNALPARCNLDITCICTDANFINDISCCVSKACDVTGQQQALDTARNICAGTNVVLPSAAGCSASTGASSTSAGSAGTAVASSATSAGSSTMAATSTTAQSASTTTSRASSAAATSATTTPNPGNKLVVNGVGLAGALFGAVAML